MRICDDCQLEVEYGPCPCHELRAEQAAIDAMDEDEYVKFRRNQDRQRNRLLFSALSLRKEAAE